MTRISVDPRPLGWTDPVTGVSSTFRPHGPWRAVGVPETSRTEGDDGPRCAVRLFVRRHVAGRACWTVDDVVRAALAGWPDARLGGEPGFWLREGVFHDRKDGAGSEEDGVQLIVVSEPGAPSKQFERSGVVLAERIAEALQVDCVVGELQRNGLQVKTFGVAPRERVARKWKVVQGG
ncbi:MAG: hypothetical protein EXR79_15665 [Myxococcales bacterium]|nr:hypothetical protein [Myxococcales bacterium]